MRCSTGREILRIEYAAISDASASVSWQLLAENMYRFELCSIRNEKVPVARLANVLSHLQVAVRHSDVQVPFVIR